MLQVHRCSSGVLVQAARRSHFIASTGHTQSVGPFAFENSRYFERGFGGAAQSGHLKESLSHSSLLEGSLELVEVNHSSITSDKSPSRKCSVTGATRGLAAPEHSQRLKLLLQVGNLAANLV